MQHTNDWLQRTETATRLTSNHHAALNTFYDNRNCTAGAVELTSEPPAALQNELAEVLLLQQRHQLAAHERLVNGHGAALG